MNETIRWVVLYVLRFSLATHLMDSGYGRLYHQICNTRVVVPCQFLRAGVVPLDPFNLIVVGET